MAALSSWRDAIEDYRISRDKVLDINMVAKHKIDAAEESVGELNMMDNPPGLPPGLEQGIIDYVNNGIANGITTATAQMNLDMQQLAKRLDDNASGHFKSLQTQITDLHEMRKLMAPKPRNI